MSTSPVVQRNSANDPSSGTRVRDWTRSSEPGAAFNGLSRGKRGGGRGGGRGTRGGRGGGGRGSGPSRANGNTSETTQATNPPATVPPQIEITSEPATAPTAPSSKGPSRRTSARAISTTAPPPAAPSTTVSAQTPPTPKSARPPNRRRRSNTQTKSTAPKLNVPPPLDQASLRSQKGRNRTLQPPHSAPLAKDTPPHLAAPNPFDMRTDIDALVERVRAVAMSDHRPSTPGSHIDWAGDDDDSLPDLDDWGVKTTTTTETRDETISPIMVEGLKSLPEPCKPPSPLGRDVASPMLPTILPPERTDVPKEPQKTTAENKTDDKDVINGSNPAKAEHKADKKAEKKGGVAEEKGAGRGTSLASKGRSDSSKPAPLHPSLPPKPVFIDTPIAKNSRTGATPMRNPAPSRFPHAHKAGLPAKPVENAKHISPPKAIEVAATKPTEGPAAKILQPVPTPSKSPDPVHVSADPVPEKPAEAPTPVPITESSTEEHKESEADDEPQEGLQASMHAPKALSDPSLAARDVAKQSIPNGHRPFNFTHNRAQTVGRPPFFAYSAPANGSSRFSRSGPATPRGGFSQHHARTHSSPPAGTMLNNHRAVHATRPVITGDAISRLARTIGGATMSSPSSKTTVSLTSKD